MKTPPDDLRRLIVVALLGIASLAAGLALAFRFLPEWRAAPAPSPAPFVESYRRIAGGLGFQPIEGSPVHTNLVTQTVGVPLACAERRPGTPAVAESMGVCAEVRQQGELPGDDSSRELSVFFAVDGRPRGVAWLRTLILGNSATETPVTPRARIDAVARLLAAPGETLGAPRTALVGGSAALFFDLNGSAPTEHLRVLSAPGGNLVVTRDHGTATEGIARNTAFLWIPVARQVLRALFIVGAVILFFLLLGKGRIDLINGALLAGILLLTMIPELFAHEATPSNLIGYGLSMGLKVIWVFLVWSAGESFLRSYQPNFTTSLDSLRAGRLGPRGSRALLYGLSLGMGMTGLRLALIVLAPHLHSRAWPEAGSLSLPLANPWASSVGQSFVLAGTVMLLMAAALRLLPARWAGLAAAVVIPLCWPIPLDLQDFWIEWALRALIAGMLVAALRRFGLTAMLTATVTFYLLPAAVYSSLSLAWMPWTFLGAGGTSVAILVLGLIGLRRPESVEAHRLVPPAFMRRLEEDRRVSYEMNLLARMQKGLLPQVPELPGWQIAARSMVATEAGGDFYDFLFDDDGHLWVAAGDVAGHGYSCAIVQAMTIAALTSLIRPGMQPSEVLLEVDRVIRRGGARRNFTSLALLRLDPRTGKVVLSNAGHPYPVMIADGEVKEIAMPGGLPLGQGPKRRYPDLTLHLPPGASLVLCSDGLTETLNFEETPYFERPQEVLRGATTMAAGEILEALLDDWRRHLGTEEAPDDTTIVVVRRVGSEMLRS